MLPLRFGYVILVLVGMIFWAAFFIHRKDLRTPMLRIGVLYGILSLITAELWWTVDWWHPETLTGTRIGIEDFFTGFGAGGVMMTIYQVFFKKKVFFDERKALPIARIIFFACALAAIHVLIRYAGLTSFVSFVFATSLATIFMWALRRDLIVPSLWSGILTTAGIFLLYWSTILTVPGWVRATYDFGHLSGILVTGIPLEELIFWFIAGSFIGILSPFTWSGKHVDYKG